MNPPAKRIEQIGDATLYLGDCLDILPTLGKVDAVVTDPPYGVNLITKTNDYRGSKYFDNGASLLASKQYRDDADYIELVVTQAAILYTAIACRSLVFSGNRMAWKYPEPDSCGTVYIPNGAGKEAWGFGCHSMILFYGKCPYLAKGLGSRPNSTSFNQPNREKIDHPCPKPIEWMLWAVNRASLFDELVLDPFMGSGTTGVACAKLGRKFIGIEIDPDYFEIACRRIEEAYRQPDLFIEPPAKPQQQSLELDYD